jgi:putative ABC transport system substrate-binding protein
VTKRVDRRKFITLLGGGAAAWPLAARGEQGGRMRRIGVLLGVTAGDSEFQRRVAMFAQELSKLGWVEGRNFGFELQYADGKLDRFPALATELVDAKVDVIITQGTESALAASKATTQRLAAHHDCPTLC